MNRLRIAVVAGVLIVFAAAGAYLIFANQGAGGESVTFNVTIIGAKTMQPGTLTVHRNDTVTISITSDTDGEVHLHGYDIHFDCKAGQVVSHTFKAVNAADFEIEWESTSTHLGHLVVNP